MRKVCGVREVIGLAPIADQLGGCVVRERDRARARTHESERERERARERARERERERREEMQGWEQQDAFKPGGHSHDNFF